MSVAVGKSAAVHLSVEGMSAPVDKSVAAVEGCKKWVGLRGWPCKEGVGP